MNIKVLWHLLTAYLATNSKAHQIEVDVFNNQAVNPSRAHRMNPSPDKLEMRDLLDAKVIKPSWVSKKQKKMIVDLFLEIAQSHHEEYCQVLLFLLDPDTKIQLHAGRIKEIHQGVPCGLACFESLTSCIHLPTDLGLSDYDYFKSVIKHELEHATDWLNNKYNGVNTYVSETIHRTYTNRYHLVLDEKGIHNASLESADRANAKIKIELQKTKDLFDGNKRNSKTDGRYKSVKACLKKIIQEDGYKPVIYIKEMRKELVDDIKAQISDGLKYPEIKNGLGEVYYVTGYSKDNIVFYTFVDPAIFGKKPSNDEETNHQLKTAIRDLKKAVYDFSVKIEKQPIEVRPDEFNAYAENYFGAHPTLRDALFPLLAETRLERESQPIKECMRNSLGI